MTSFCMAIVYYILYVYYCLYFLSAVASVIAAVCLLVRYEKTCVVLDALFGVRVPAHARIIKLPSRRKK